MQLMSEEEGKTEIFIGLRSWQKGRSAGSMTMRHNIPAEKLCIIELVKVIPLG